MLIRLPRAILLLLTFTAMTVIANAQEKSSGKDEFAQLLDFSRPNAHHQLLAAFVGSWTFQDKDRAFIKGTLVRRSIYSDRFFTVGITGGKLPLPIANGKMKEDNYQGMQIEGYDNGRGVFVSVAINNHIGSDIDMQTGSYDSSAKTFTFNSESELIPGEKIKTRRVVRLIDPDHYLEEYFEEHDGRFTKVRQLDYTRSTPQN